MNLNDKNQIVKDDIDVELLFLEGTDETVKKFYIDKLITSAPLKREWLNKPEQKYGYQCQPMVAANQMGWHILSSSEIIINWNGGQSTNDVFVKQINDEINYNYAASHFSVGIVTFSFPFVVKTPPGWGIWVGPPSNEWIVNMQGLQGIVETNWLPFSFTMNWKILEENKTIVIPKYFPIAKMIPFPLNLNEKININYKNITEYPDFNKKFKDYSESRGNFNKSLKEIPNNPDFTNVQGFYKKGTDSKGCPYLGMHKLFYKYKDVKKT